MSELSPGTIYRPTSKVILFSGDRIIAVTGKSDVVNLTGGGIDPTDRDPECAARREMREELGIEPGHIRNLELHGLISGPTGKPSDTPTISEWYVHSADLIVPMDELVPNPEEIRQYGGYYREELLANPRLSKLAYRALVNFT